MVLRDVIFAVSALQHAVLFEVVALRYRSLGCELIEFAAVLYDLSKQAVKIRPAGLQLLRERIIGIQFYEP